MDSSAQTINEINKMKINLSNLSNSSDTDYANNTQFCVSSTVFTAIYATTTTLIGVIGVFGNGLVLILLKRYPILRGPNNQYLLPVHLAVVHLIRSVTLITYPFETISFNSTVGEIREALVITLFISNGGSLFISACKRVFVAFRPLVFVRRKHEETKILSILLSVLWIFSLCVGFSSIIMNRKFPSETKTEETIANWSALSISLLTRIITVTFFFIIIVFIATFYFKVYAKFKKGNRTSGSSITQLPRPFAISIVTVIIYSICWFPFCCVLIIMGTDPGSCCTCSFILLIGFLDTAVSWTTYPLLDRKFRTALKEVLFCPASIKEEYFGVQTNCELPD